MLLYPDRGWRLDCATKLLLSLPCFSSIAFCCVSKANDVLRTKSLDEDSSGFSKCISKLSQPTNRSLIKFFDFDGLILRRYYLSKD